MTVLSEKEVVCPTCYLATKLMISTEPRMPAPSMLWLCRECKDIAVFDANLDLRIASDAEKAKAIRPMEAPGA